MSDVLPADNNFIAYAPYRQAASARRIVLRNYFLAWHYYNAATAVEWHRSFSQSARASRKQLPTKTTKNEPGEWSISDFRRKYVPERSDELDSERYQPPASGRKSTAPHISFYNFFLIFFLRSPIVETNFSMDRQKLANDFEVICKVEFSAVEQREINISIDYISVLTSCPSKYQCDLHEI